MDNVLAFTDWKDLGLIIQTKTSFRKGLWRLLVVVILNCHKKVAVANPAKIDSINLEWYQIRKMENIDSTDVVDLKGDRRTENVHGIAFM